MDLRNLVPFVAAMAATGIACSHASEPSAATTEHLLKSVILESGNPGNTLTKGYSSIEQASVYCGYSVCTLGMRIMSNVGTATCKSEWAIVGLVDGNYVDGGPLLESLPNAGETQTHVWQGMYTVGVGNHTITFQLYLPCSANANQWSVRYLLTAP
jgi:hypothetical protein